MIHPRQPPTVEYACQPARRWSWTGGSCYLVVSFCLFVHFLCVFLILYVCVCLSFLSSFFLCFCDGGICMPACSQMVLDRWLLIFIWLFLFLVFVCECFSFCVFFCVHALACVGLLVFFCWWNLSARLLADDFGQTVFLGSLGGISILDRMDNGSLSSEFEQSICLLP